MNIKKNILCNILHNALQNKLYMRHTDSNTQCNTNNILLCSLKVVCKIYITKCIIKAHICEQNNIKMIKK